MNRLIPHWLAAAALLAGGAAAAQVQLPVRELLSHEIGNLSGMPFLDPSNQTFRVAAAVAVSAYNKGSPAQGVQRSVGSNAAVYRGAPGSVSPPPVLPPMPAPTALFDFITTGDLAQSWATMTSNGLPYLYAVGYGEFSADATASWNTTLTVPGPGSREIVVRFVIPPVGVSGNTEQEGIARWRSRLRSELLVNGFPAWSNESIRLTIDPHEANGNLSQTLVLQQFGNPLTFPTNDENSDPADDTTTGTINGTSDKRTVYLNLGRFNAGTVVDLSMILRASALTVPASTGGTDHRCKYSSSLARWFCSRGSVSVNGGTGEAPRVYYLP